MMKQWHSLINKLASFNMEDVDADIAGVKEHIDRKQDEL